jgi:Rrf2 family protein
VAVQALIVLTHSDGVCPSQAIAGNLHSHAVFLRRVLAHLARAQIVEAREGRDGGYRLSRPAATITLAEVYQAVKSVAPSEPPVSGAVQACDGAATPGAVGMRVALAEITAEAEDAFLAVLGHHTIGELAGRAAALSAGV